MLSKHTRTRLLWRDGKRVRAHRWIMEQHLGRKLEPHEQVHHKDGNPLNNAIENLEVMLCGPHMRLHKQRYPDQKQCVECGAEFTANPRKRKRQKCCSSKCAQTIRVRAALQARGLC
jgi:hypothetical protein